MSDKFQSVYFALTMSVIWSATNARNVEWLHIYCTFIWLALASVQGWAVWRQGKRELAEKQAELAAAQTALAQAEEHFKAMMRRAGFTPAEDERPPTAKPN